MPAVPEVHSHNSNDKNHNNNSNDNFERGGDFWIYVSKVVLIHEYFQQYHVCYQKIGTTNHKYSARLSRSWYKPVFTEQAKVGVTVILMHKC